jgi:hypothetical protein
VSDTVNDETSISRLPVSSPQELAAKLIRREVDVLLSKALEQASISRILP